MTANAESGGADRVSRLRIAAWSFAVFLLVLPAIAMQFTDEVNWDSADFVFASVMIIGTGALFELAARMTRNRAYRAATGVALAAAFLLIWVNAAVGIIGSENNPANWMYAGVLAVAVVGAVIARGRPRGMARTMLSTAAAQVVVMVIALVGDLGGDATPPLELVVLNGWFVGMWGAAAGLFGRTHP